MKYPTASPKTQKSRANTREATFLARDAHKAKEILLTVLTIAQKAHRAKAYSEVRKDLDYLCEGLQKAAYLSLTPWGQTAAKGEMRVDIRQVIEVNAKQRKGKS